MSQSHNACLCVLLLLLFPPLLLLSLLLLLLQVHEPKDEEVYSDKPYIGKEGLEA